MEIVIASNNKDKVNEYRKILSEFDIKCISLKELNIVCDPVETGNTFQENSLIKAKEIAKFTDKVIIADDSGLVVDAIPNELGVYSHRFMGEDTPYPIKCLEVIKQVEGKTRSARFECCITLLNFDETPHQFNGVLEGNIGYEIKGEHGFGYDPIFIPDGYSESCGVLGTEIKNKISHRAKALEKLCDFLKHP